MGLVRPLQLLDLLGPPLLSPPPRFLSRWGGGGCSGLGGCPPSLVSGRAQRACAPARGVPPPLLRAGGCPPPSPPCSFMPCAGSVRCSGGDHSTVAWYRLPPSLSCMPCAGSAHCSGGPPVASSGVWAPPLPCMPCAGSARCSGGVPYSSSWFGDPPLPSLAYLVLGVHAAVWGGPPPSSGIGLSTVGACSLYPSSSCPRAGCVRSGDGSPLLRPGTCLAVGSRAALFRVPSRVPAARCGRAVGVLWACCGRAVGVLWACCGRAVGR